MIKMFLDEPACMNSTMNQKSFECDDKGLLNAFVFEQFEWSKGHYSILPTFKLTVTIQLLKSKNKTPTPTCRYIPSSNLSEIQKCFLLLLLKVCSGEGVSVLLIAGGYSHCSLLHKFFHITLNVPKGIEYKPPKHTD